jgi:hypothetical protein
MLHNESTMIHSYLHIADGTIYRATCWSIVHKYSASDLSFVGRVCQTYAS